MKNEPVKISSSIIIDKAPGFWWRLNSRGESNETIQWSVNISASLGSNTSVTLTWSGMLEITKSRTLFPHVRKPLCWIRKWSLRTSTKHRSLAAIQESGQSHGTLGRFKSPQISILSNLLQVSSRNQTSPSSWNRHKAACNEQSKNLWLESVSTTVDTIFTSETDGTYSWIDENKSDLIAIQTPTATLVDTILPVDCVTGV